MKTCRILLAAVISAFLATACTTGRPDPQRPTLESRKSGEWRKTASCVHSGAYTIYYHGEAQPAPNAKRHHWVGHITGDIFVIGPQGYVIIPNGRFTITPNGALSTYGPHTTYLIDQSGH